MADNYVQKRTWAEAVESKKPKKKAAPKPKAAAKPKQAAANNGGGAEG